MSSVPEDLPGASVQEDGFAVPQSLQSSEQKKLLNTIDNLRSWDVGSYLHLPQLIVCGIQSSGKSSVMEAISGVPFPRDVSTCTRFATEIVLRREPSTSVTVSILPGKSRGPKDRERVERFRMHLNNYDGFPQLFAQASEAMGLSEKKIFSDDILKVEITGPNQPQLELVDLPGLITSAEDQNIKLVEDLVRSYMSNPRSIILAVVMAIIDADIQSVLKLAKEYDPQGKRTLGILTKLDLLENAPVKEKDWRKVTRNEDEKFSFELGWHVLRNVDSGREGMSNEEHTRDRDQIEKRYFDTSNFNADPAKRLGLGIVTLRERLSKILFQHIQKHLEDLMKEIEAGINHSKEELERLGPQRLSKEEQQRWLGNLSTQFGRLCEDAIQGIYVKKFFRDEARPNARLCAAVLNAHEKFGEDVDANGRGWKEVDDDLEDPDEGLLSHDYLIEMTIGLLDANRGTEWRVSMNPAVTEQLFYRYSRSWHRLARSHLESQYNIMSAFLYEVATFVADPDTCNKIYSLWISERLGDLFADAKVELKKVLDVYNRQPMTANPLFSKRILELQQDYFQSSGDKDENKASEEPVHISPSQKTAELALRSVEAFYDATMPTYVDNVLTLAIWAPMVLKLPDIFSTDTVNSMTQEEVQNLAGESAETQQYRAQLRKKLDALEKGRKACGLYAVPKSNARDKPTIPSSNSKGASNVANSLNGKPDLDANRGKARVLAPSPAAADTYGTARSALTSMLSLAPAQGFTSQNGSPGNTSKNANSLFGSAKPNNASGAQVSTSRNTKSSNLFGATPSNSSPNPPSVKASSLFATAAPSNTSANSPSLFAATAPSNTSGNSSSLFATAAPSNTSANSPSLFAATAPSNTSGNSSSLFATAAPSSAFVNPPSPFAGAGSALGSSNTNSGNPSNNPRPSTSLFQTPSSGFGNVNGSVKRPSSAFGASAFGSSPLSSPGNTQGTS